MADFQVWTVTEPYLEPHCKLGEGPFYEAATNTLRFVDIIQKRLHTVNLTEGPSSLTTLQLDAPVTVTADIEGVDPTDKILIGIKHGLAVLDRKTGTYEYVSRLGGEEGNDNERVRTNDGAADPSGRFWLGTMTDFGKGEFKPEGAFFLFDNSKATKVIPDLTIPNSVGWSPDNKTFYATHSTTGEILAFDYDLATGALSNRRLFYKHDGADPDGFRVDVNGDLWSAVYGEARVLKISGAEGKLVGEVRLPTRNATCTQFVGTELFITTANDDQAEGGEESKRLGGAVFRVDVGVEGLELFKYKL
ncbi:related to senescence marker protein 30 [Cephalotrichum gorgonifer]|uniref:Related to senescence marker protein 30 n=1 Tax=Cephalotrichum gorgonifer TaxID=2041049 RepID=A0AAE8N141_9PEZI|nr:related to senescence marker protein 30 [Cephalotrichum gorgonifer]